MNPRSIRQSRRGLVALIACAVAVTAGCAPETRPPEPNLPAPELVVLISLDTLRADRLGCYGAKRDTSPHLDRLASEGIRFSTVGAQATQTLISHKSMFAARYPLGLAHDANNATLDKLATLEDPTGYMVATFRACRAPSLVGQLRSHGYATAAFTDGAWMTREMGFAGGFGSFDQRGGHLAALLPRVFGWLARNMSGPQFLFIHTYDTHCPYWCREPYNSMFCRDHTKHIALAGRCGKTGLMELDLTDGDLRGISAHYDAGIASADAYLGELFDKLRALGRYDQALIVVTSDHGESLGARGQIGHGGLYLEQLLVPLIIKFPASWGLSPAVVQQPVALVDLMPTILDACGLQPPADADGRSLLPVIRSGARGRRALVAQMTYNEGRGAVTNPCKRALLIPERWLLIHDARGNSSQLYELTSDPHGLVNVADERPERLAALVAALAVYDAGSTSGAFQEPNPPEIPDELREELESLGYIGP